MENMSFGAIASILLVAIIALSVIYNLVKDRRSRAGTGSSGAPVPDNESRIDDMSALLTAVSTVSKSQGAFETYLADHSQEQLDDVPVYALAHLMTASLNSPSRSKWLSSVIDAVVPRGVDAELINTAEYFWDVNDRWTFSENCAGIFCKEYLIAHKDEWSPEIKERIVMAGLATLASSDFEGTYSGADHDRVVGEFRKEMDAVAAVYFGAEAPEMVAALDARARMLAPQICAKTA